MGKNTSAAILAVRLLGLFWFVAGLWMLAANILESATAFNPAYIGYYLQSQALRPLLAIGIGVGLMFFACTLGRLLGRGLDSKDNG